MSSWSVLECGDKSSLNIYTVNIFFPLPFPFSPLNGGFLRTEILNYDTVYFISASLKLRTFGDLFIKDVT